MELFFAVFMDTTFKVADFSLPKRYDPSQEILKFLDELPYKAFPPSCSIDTMDLFMAHSGIDPVGSIEAVSDLFRLGRPLWDGRLESGDSLFEIIAIPSRHLGGRGVKVIGTPILPLELSHHKPCARR